METDNLYTKFEHVEIDSCIHAYKLYIHDTASDMARMNDGDYLAEIITLIVAPDHAIVVSNNDANDWSTLVDSNEFGYDASYPDHEETLKAIQEKMEEKYINEGGEVDE